MSTQKSEKKSVRYRVHVTVISYRKINLLYCTLRTSVFCSKNPTKIFSLREERKFKQTKEQHNNEKYRTGTVLRTYTETLPRKKK